MKGTLKLVKPVKSKKYLDKKGEALELPANEELNAFVDENMEVFVEHPNYKGIYTKVSPMNLTECKWDKIAGLSC